MPVYKSYYQYLYSCPVVELSGYAARHGLPGRLLAYLDFAGPTGSAKDGLAEGMLALAAQRGALAKGQPVVEASTGTFAAALTIAARRSGHPVYLVAPPTLPGERQKLLRQLGARLELCTAALARRKDLEQAGVLEGLGAGFLGKVRGIPVRLVQEGGHVLADDLVVRVLQGLRVAEQGGKGKNRQVGMKESHQPSSTMKQASRSAGASSQLRARPPCSRTFCQSAASACRRA